MKQNVNGWNILADELERIPGSRKVVKDLLGKRFDYNQVADGKYLLDSHEVSLIFQILRTDCRTRMDFLNTVITSRNHLKYLDGLEGFHQLFCETVGESSVNVPCISLGLLKNYHPGNETLYEFISREAETSIRLMLPESACALQICGDESETSLNLPVNTLVFVDGETCAKSEEVALVCRTDHTFSMERIQEDTAALWNAPVLRIHFRPLLSEASEIEE